ncbi:MAG: hypothetical protein MUF10_11255 [Thermoanaerobaculaceae bacterium]|nr:hypothetical protein [Thermoanaerobaculaceae bacterium]
MAEGKFIGVQWAKGSGPDALLAAFARAPKRTIILLSRILRAGAQQIRGSVSMGDFFDEPSGELQRSTWVGKVERVGDELAVEMGWAHRYGPVLEFGSELAGWWIRAKWATRLRFRVGGSMVYPKEVWHEYTADQMRPHWGPTIEKKWPEVQRQLDLVPEEVLK